MGRGTRNDDDDGLSDGKQLWRQSLVIMKLLLELNSTSRHNRYKLDCLRFPGRSVSQSKTSQDSYLPEAGKAGKPKYITMFLIKVKLQLNLD